MKDYPVVQEISEVCICVRDHQCEQLRVKGQVSRLGHPNSDRRKSSSSCARTISTTVTRETGAQRAHPVGRAITIDTFTVRPTPLSLSPTKSPIRHGRAASSTSAVTRVRRRVQRRQTRYLQQDHGGRRGRDERRQEAGKRRRLLAAAAPALGCRRRVTLLVRATGVGQLP